MRKLLKFILPILGLIVIPQIAHSANSPKCTRKITGQSGKLYVLKTSFTKNRVISINKRGSRSFPAKISDGQITYKASGDHKWYTLSKEGQIFRAGQSNPTGTHNCDIDSIITYMNNL